MKGLNLSKFKKTAEDKMSATMIHEDGHTLKISKGSLAPLQRKQLESLPIHNYAKGGEIMHYDEGTPPGGAATLDRKDFNTDDQYNSALTALNPGMSQGDAMAQMAIDTKAKNMLPGENMAQFRSRTQSPDNDPSVMADKSSDSMQKDSSPDMKADAVSTQDTVPTQADIIAQDQAATSAPSAPTGPSPASVAPVPQDNNQMFGYAGLQEQKAAQLEQAKALGTQGQTESALLSQYAAARARVPSIEAATALFNQSNQVLEKAYQDKTVDPNKYWNDHSKVAAGIGMIFSGLGNGLNKMAGNGAYEAMQAGINRDVEAQKNSQDKAMNLWKMNRDTFGSNVAATLATQNQLAEGLKYNIMKAAADAKGPQALAAAHDAIGKIDASINVRSNILGLNAGLTQRAGGGTEQEFVNNLNTAAQVAPELHKEAIAKYIPDVGISRVPLTNEDRSSLTSMDNLEKQIDRGINFANTQGTQYNPLSVKSQEAADIQNGIQLEIGNLVGLKRINEFEADKYTKMAGSPGSFRTGAAVQSLKDLKQNITFKKQAMSQNLGIMPFSKANPEQVALQWARSNPNDPRAAAIIQKISGKK